MKKENLSDILTPIEIKSVNKFSGKLTGSSNYNNHVFGAVGQSETVQVSVYETKMRYHFLVESFDGTTDRWYNYKAYSGAKTNLIAAKEIAELLVETPNWLDWDDNEYTYDIVFNDNEKSDFNGFKSDYQYCKDYIDLYNGTKEGYFECYKGGTVSIRRNETEEVVFETEVL